jgi:hypothetical protein
MEKIIKLNNIENLSSANKVDKKSFSDNFNTINFLKELSNEEQHNLVEYYFIMTKLKIIKDYI